MENIQWASHSRESIQYLKQCLIFSGFNRTGLTLTGLNLTGFGRIETCINCTFQVKNVQISYQGGDGGGGNGTGGGGGGGGGGGDIDVKRTNQIKTKKFQDL